MKTFQEYLEDAGGEPRTYSGRGMYGKQCLSVVMSQSSFLELQKNIIGEIIDEIENYYDGDDEYGEFDSDKLREYINTLLSYSMDNLGLEFVFYWPAEEYVEANPTDEEITEIEEELEDDNFNTVKND